MRMAVAGVVAVPMKMMRSAVPVPMFMNPARRIHGDDEAENRGGDQDDGGPRCGIEVETPIHPYSCRRGPKQDREQDHPMKTVGQLAGRDGRGDDRGRDQGDADYLH